MVSLRYTIKETNDSQTSYETVRWKRQVLLATGYADNARHLT